MGGERQHWMTSCSLLCFVTAAALMITSLDPSQRHAGRGPVLDASHVPITLAFSPWGPATGHRAQAAGLAGLS